MQQNMQQEARTATPMVIQLVANPAAGAHSARRVAELSEAFQRGGAEVLFSHSGPRHPFAVDPRATHLCVVGGDGTMRHVALAAQSCGRPLGLSFYPAGTINLIHREAPCALAPADYVANILGRAGPRRHYPARLNDTLFLACASVGPDSEAVAALSPRLKRRIGRLAYAVAFPRVLVNWRRHEIILCHDGRATRCEAFYVAKGRYFAGPWSFAPAARSDEALLHVVALRKCTRRAWLRFAWLMLRGRSLADFAGAICFTCTSLTADAGLPLPVQADGDIAATLPVAIQVEPEPLLFF
jgi:diacylglycerol kinase family enzyme